MEWSNLLNWLGGDLATKERREMRRSWDEAQAAWKTSRFPGAQLTHELLAIVHAAEDRAHVQLAGPVVCKAAMVVDELLFTSGVSFCDPDWNIIYADPAVAIEFRQFVKRRYRWCTSFNTMFQVFENAMVEGLSRVLTLLPEACTGTWEADDEFFGVPLIEMVDDPAEVVGRLSYLAYMPALRTYDICTEAREHLGQRLLYASGFQSEEEWEKRQPPLTMPADQKKMAPVELAETYLAGTAMLDFAKLVVPFHISDEARFEHCHIVGGTGHGKTQLMQRMIHHDLVAAQTRKRSVVVIDSQGDLINKLVRLELFDPDSEHSLAHKLVLIDPADVEFPCALNLFDSQLERLQGYSPADRERVLNGVVELYEMFFSSMLGAELTSKQGVIFRYLARLMMVIPNANIHTLMQIMQDGRPFKPYMRQMEGSARWFFEKEFFDKSFGQTKQQILKRLWGVLSTPAFERMFAQPTNKLNLFEALNDGKIILISTAKDLLKNEGSALFGRFFIGMLAQVALERSTQAPDDRTPTYVYIDEAQEYFDDSIATILNQARKYKVGLTLAHQALDQLAPSLRSAILANTSLKCVGGVSSKDASTLSGELRVSSDFVETMKRHRDRTEFAVWLKHKTPHAVRLSIPLGFLERQPLMSEDAFDEVITNNRLRYGTPLDDLPQHAFADEFFAEPEEDEPKARRPAPPPQEKPATRTVKPEPEPTPETEEEIAAPPADPVSPPYTNAERTENAEAFPIPEAAPVRSPAGPKPRKPNAERELGKGGSQHRYVQTLIKGLGEERGFRAVIEAPVAGGQVDVALYREELSIACEISVSSAAQYEAQNLAKCAAAGFTYIFAIGNNAKRLKAIETLAKEALSEDDFAKVLFLTPDAVAAVLDELTPAATEENIVNGYKVKVSRKTITSTDAKERRESIARIIANSLRNMPKK